MSHYNHPNQHPKQGFFRRDRTVVIGLLLLTALVIIGFFIVEAMPHSGI